MGIGLQRNDWPFKSSVLTGMREEGGLMTMLTYDQRPMMTRRHTAVMGKKQETRFYRVSNKSKHFH